MVLPLLTIFSGREAAVKGDFCGRGRDAAPFILCHHLRRYDEARSSRTRGGRRDARDVSTAGDPVDAARGLPRATPPPSSYAGMGGPRGAPVEAGAGGGQAEPDTLSESPDESVVPNGAIRVSEPFKLEGIAKDGGDRPPTC